MSNKLYNFRKRESKLGKEANSAKRVTKPKTSTHRILQLCDLKSRTHQRRKTRTTKTMQEEWRKWDGNSGWHSFLVSNALGDCPWFAKAASLKSKYRKECCIPNEHLPSYKLDPPLTPQRSAQLSYYWRLLLPDLNIAGHLWTNWKEVLQTPPTTGPSTLLLHLNIPGQWTCLGLKRLFGALKMLLLRSWPPKRYQRPTKAPS